jgi:hypothetical protein
MSPFRKYFHVFDDFLDHPDRVRNRALKCKYTLAHSYIPGYVTDENIRIAEFTEKVNGLRPSLIEKGEPPLPPFRDVGRFQYFIKSRKTYVHPDLHRWVAVLFLCDRKDEFPGTTFYEHKATGLRCFPVREPEWLLDRLSGEPPDPRTAQTVKDRYKYDRWKPIATLPGKYNRLILFRGEYFHMNASQWGSSSENSRLTFVCRIR